MSKAKPSRGQGRLTRRDFVKFAMGATAVVAFGQDATQNLVQELLAASSSKPSSTNGRRWVLVMDQDECIGCNRCTWACKAVNDFPGDIYWNVVFSEGAVGRKGNLPVYLPRPCMMCEEPPCVEVCPVRATYKREGDGLVVMDYDLCIGCRYCMTACPYGARYFNWKEPDEVNKFVPDWGKPEIPRRIRGLVEKCTFCKHRLDSAVEKGLTPGVDPEATPACVVVCPAPARFFGELDGKIAHPEFGEISKSKVMAMGRQLKKELGTKPRVYYLPPRGE